MQKLLDMTHPSSLGICLIAALFLGACSGDDVDGTWCGRDVEAEDECVGDDAHFVTLAQSGDSVTGTWCEAFPSKDCTDIDEASFDGDVLRLEHFSFDGSALELTLDGDVMTGNFHGCSTCDAGPCMCELPVTLHRL